MYSINDLELMNTLDFKQEYDEPFTSEELLFCIENDLLDYFI